MCFCLLTLGLANRSCRSCNTLLDFKSVMKPIKPGKSDIAPEKSAEKSPETSAGSRLPGGYSRVEPPDVEQLGRSSWSLLHSIAATYPENPDSKKQADLKQFLKLFGNFYPCWYCGEDFQRYIDKNEPKVESQDTFGTWLCEAHNDVNKKLRKPQFDCNLWKQRWRDGWDD